MSRSLPPIRLGVAYADHEVEECAFQSNLQSNGDCKFIGAIAEGMVALLRLSNQSFTLISYGDSGRVSWGSKTSNGTWFVIIVYVDIFHE
jgi:hypothetical protein